MERTKYYYWWLKVSISSPSPGCSKEVNRIFGSENNIHDKYKIEYFFLLWILLKGYKFWAVRMMRPEYTTGRVAERTQNAIKQNDQNVEQKTDNFFLTFISMDRYSRNSEFRERKILKTAGSLFQIGYIVVFSSSIFISMTVIMHGKHKKHTNTYKIVQQSAG